MRIEQEPIPSAEEILDKHFSHSYYTASFAPYGPKDKRQIHDRDCLRCEYDDRIIKAMEEHLKSHIDRIKYEYSQYQFFLDGYRNGSASISEVTAAHDTFLKLLE